MNTKLDAAGTYLNLAILSLSTYFPKLGFSAAVDLFILFHSVVHSQNCDNSRPLFMNNQLDAYCCEEQKLAALLFSILYNCQHLLWGRLVCKNEQTRPLASLFLDKRNRLEKEIQEGEQCNSATGYRWFFYFLLFYIFLTDMHESQPPNVKWIQFGQVFDRKMSRRFL